MRQRTIHRVFVLVALVLVSATITLGQSSKATDVLTLNPSDTWQGAQLVGASNGKLFRKLFVVTVEHPDHRQTCRIRSFTPDKLVCSRGLGGPRIFLPQQVIALIVPGDEGLRIKLVLGFNAGLGAAIWGTVVLAAACPACAVATGIAAFFFFGAAGATLIGDGQPDRLLFVAPGQELSRKLGYVQYREP